MANRFHLPNLGYGVGLRSVHFGYILESLPKVDWFEIISENYIGLDGFPLYALDQVAERYPVVMHGVSLSIGSSDPLDFAYLAKLKALADRISPVWISDHLCWTGVAGVNTHDLLPVPLTEAALDHIVDRIRIVQDFLERPLVLENPSTYLEFEASTIDDCEFMARMADQADCGILLDVNNVYVNARNHGWDAVRYIHTVPPDRIVQFHLAGHDDLGTHVIDSHNAPVVDAVWELYRIALAHVGADGASTLLEWDANIPSFPAMLKELDKAKGVAPNHCSSFVVPPPCSKEGRALPALPHPAHFISVERESFVADDEG